MSYSKSLLALVLTSSLLVGCNGENTPTPKTEAPAGYDEVGGVDGGGGGTLPANPIHFYRVREIIQDVKNDLVPWANRELWGATWHGPFSEIERKLFYGKPNILDIINNTDIEIKYAEACKDAYGKDVDGSVHASTPNAICISAHRIAPKLEEEKARTEIAALIVHELSHKLGATESEAVEIQKQVAYHLALRESESVTGEQFVQKAYYESMQVRSAVSSLKEFLETKTSESPKELEQALFKFSEARDLFDRMTSTPTFALLDGEQHAYAEILSARFMVAQWALIQDEAPDIKQDLDKVFKDKTQVTYEAFREAMYPKSDSVALHPFRNELISRPQTPAEIKSIVSQSLEFYSAASEIAMVLQFGSRPNPIPLPSNQQDVFDQFVGTFEVKSVSCTSPKDQTYTGYRIEKGPTGKTQLVRLVTNGTYSGGDLLTGGSNISTGHAMLVSGGQDWATREIEFSNRWGSRQRNFSKISFALKKTATGYQAIEASLFRDEIFSWEQPEKNRFVDTSNSCTYELIKTN